MYAIDFQEKNTSLTPSFSNPIEAIANAEILATAEALQIIAHLFWTVVACISSWWFQPDWKILIKLEIFPK